MFALNLTSSLSGACLVTGFASANAEWGAIKMLGVIIITDNKIIKNRNFVLNN